MKKVYIFILVIMASVIIFLVGENIYLKNNTGIAIYKRDTKGTFKNALSMMLETDVGSGEYESITMTEWPSDGYIFNKELSKCENGGELDWDSVNNQVIVISGSSDKCYVYFDKYTSVVINSLGLTSTPTSISVNVTATAGTGTIVKYMYSIDNGEYIESESNTYTFSNLESSKEYSISVKAIDSNGLSSLVKTETITTSAYVNPSITTVTSNVAWNQISVTVSAQNGTNTISKYYYSINGGTYQETTSNTYTFTGLTASTSYTIKTKVVDTQGKESSERTDTITTSAYVLANITSLTTGVTTNTIKVTPVITKGTGTVSKYYYSKDGGSSYTESTSSSYTFTGLGAATTYSIKVYVKDSNGKSSSVYTKSVKTSGMLLAAYIKGLYTSQGINGLYYHTSTLTNGAGDSSYRYAGASGDVNNYVCFGSDVSTCPDDNLYRIIGVFDDQVKLIKSDFATSTALGTNGAYSSSTYIGSNFSNYKGSLTSIDLYYRNTSSTNIWGESNLNTINLNTNYISYFNNINTKWANMIAATTWKVGGNTWANIGSSSMNVIYQNEIVSPALNTTYDAKIGLMYVSDYGYAASPTYWTCKGNNNSTTDYRSAISANWMFSGIQEWTITRNSGSSSASSAYGVALNGEVSNGVNYGNAVVRPCFYLNSTVIYTGVGNGQKTSPYRLS